MIHYTCDRCKRSINANDQARYVVQIDIQSLADQLNSETDDDIDQLSVLHEQLDELDAHPCDPHECECNHHGRYDLCRQCYEQLLRNPLGREAMLALGFSNN
jgi:hypothetical protein